MTTRTAAKILNQRRGALGSFIEGKAEANAASLSRSYGLDLADTKRIFLLMGVRDNG